MRNDRAAKSRRRSVALTNLKKQLEAWKSAKSPEEILSLLSTKLRERLGDNPTPDNLNIVRKRKIENAQIQIKVLENIR